MLSPGLCAGEEKQLWARQEPEAGLGRAGERQQGWESRPRGSPQQLCLSGAGGGGGAGLGLCSCTSSSSHPLSSCRGLQRSLLLPEIMGMASKLGENPAGVWGKQVRAEVLSGRADMCPSLGSV